MALILNFPIMARRSYLVVEKVTYNGSLIVMGIILTIGKLETNLTVGSFGVKLFLQGKIKMSLQILLSMRKCCLLHMRLLRRLIGEM